MPHLSLNFLINYILIKKKCVYTFYKNDRSSHWGVIRSYSENFHNIHRKTSAAIESLFNKVAALQTCNLKETPTQVFSSEYCKFFMWRKSANDCFWNNTNQKEKFRNRIKVCLIDYRSNFENLAEIKAIGRPWQKTFMLIYKICLLLLKSV